MASAWTSYPSASERIRQERARREFARRVDEAFDALDHPLRYRLRKAVMRMLGKAY
jgi:hypothetical protein